jgi:hypothetical protein
MASQWVDDPSWGGIAEHFGNSLFGAAASGADYRIKGAQYRELLDKIARERAQDAALRGVISTRAAEYDAMPKPPAVIQMPPVFSFNQPYSTDIDPTTGDVLAGAVTATAKPSPPIGENAAGVANPEGILRLENTPDSWGLNDEFNRKRASSFALENYGTRLSKNPAELFQTRGLGEVTMGGVPTDPAVWAERQTQLTGHMPTTEGKTPHNWVTYDENGQINAKGATFDGRTIAGTTTPLPSGWTLAAPATLNPPSPYGTKKDAMEALAPLALAANQGKPISEADIQRANILINRAFEPTSEDVQQGDRTVRQIVRKDIIPPEFNRIVELTNDYNTRKHLEPAAGPPTAEGVSPLPASNYPLISNAPQTISTGPIKAMALADNLRGEPAYKTYDTVVREWNGLARMAQGGPDGRYTNGTDVSLIYGLAKIFDPGSVVRESELNLMQAVGTLPQRLQAAITRNWDGTGVLPAQVRADLLQAAHERTLESRDQWELLAQTYAERAQRGGVNPADVVPRVLEPRVFDYKDVLARGERSVAATDQSIPEKPPEDVRRDAVRRQLRQP